MNDQASQYIDAKGLNCPVPLMLLKKAIQDLPEGSVITIDVTDIHAELDFETWCERFGHQLDKLADESGVFTFKVTK